MKQQTNHINCDDDNQILAAHNSAAVADLWGRQGGGSGCWEVHYRRSFQDWEFEEVTRFLEHISAVKVQEGEDSLVWKIDGRGKFNVKLYYRSLRAENCFLFPAKEICGSYAPLRTRFFAWEAVLGKFLIVNMLIKRGWSMVHRGNLCKDGEESTDHILIHCGKTREQWTSLLSSFGLVWVFLASVRNLFLEWKVKGAKEEEDSLEIDTYLSFLMYLGRAKPKNVPRGRVVKPMFEEPLFLFSSKVVSIVF